MSVHGVREPVRKRPNAEHFAVEEAPAAMRAAAAEYEQRYGTRFATLTYFSRDLLAALHAHDGAADRPAGVYVSSSEDPSVVQDLAEITVIANRSRATEADRIAYRDALLRIYHKLPAGYPAPDGVLCIGPEREGRLLAAMLDCLPPERSLTPTAKRISYRGGILVGLSELPAAIDQQECLVIDGVVASGATVMALLTALPATVTNVTLLTAHSTLDGLWGIQRHAAELGIESRIEVGHVSGVLNDSFYATDEQDGARVVLGDVGDAISGLPEPSDLGAASTRR